MSLIQLFFKNLQIRLPRYMRSKKEKTDKSFNPTFRNTRSKLYTHKPSFETEERSSNIESNTTNTGNYWKEKGNQAFKMRQYDHAIQLYTKAIEINPSDSLYYSNRSKCFQKIGKLQLSLKDAEAACELDEDNIKAHYICGCILAEMGKTDDSKLSKAENRLKKSLRLCRTKQMLGFQQQISIKSFRLKKLMWLKQRQKKIKSIEMEREIVNSLMNSNSLSRQNYENIMSRLNQQLEILNQPRQIPDHLICKITIILMEDPVVSEEGFSYERSAIEQHYKVNGLIEPITRKPVTGKIFPNHSLKQAIEQFLKDNPWAFEEEKCEQYKNIPFI